MTLPPWLTLASFLSSVRDWFSKASAPISASTATGDLCTNANQRGLSRKRLRRQNPKARRHDTRDPLAATRRSAEAATTWARLPLTLPLPIFKATPSRLIGRREARKIRTPQGFFRREGVTGGGPASGASARGTYGARAPGRSDLTGSVTKGLRAQRIASIHFLDSRV